MTPIDKEYDPSAGEAKIRVTRPSGGHRDLLRGYTVLIDGQAVGKLRRGSTRDFALAPGDHRVRAKIDWTGSEELVVSLHAGEVIELECKPSGGPMRSFRQIQRDGDQYLVLHRVHKP
jgi:hypothetical protein